MKTISQFNTFAISQEELKSVKGGLSPAVLAPIPDGLPTAVVTRLTLLVNRYGVLFGKAASYWTGIPGEPVDPRFQLYLQRASAVLNRYNTILDRYDG